MDPNQSINPIELGGRALVWLLLLVWGIGFIRTPIAYGEINESFMHNVNLVFHEAGHVIFALLGNFMATLGGTLGQLLMPAIVLIAFARRYDNAFGASVALWWLGQSLLDVAPYIYDARFQELMLLGGVTGRDAPGYHDWNTILGRLGWLERDQGIATGCYWLGTLVISAALGWGALLLGRQFKALRGPSKSRDRGR